MTKINNNLLIANIYSLKQGSALNFDENIKSLEGLDDAEKIISIILNFSLTKRESEIMLSRTGIFTSNIITLEMLGSHFNVSRERIRQIEKKANRKLRHPSKALYLKGVLKTLKPEIDMKLFQEFGLINKSYSKNIFKFLSHTERFLISVLYESFSKFLDSNYRYIDPFWMKNLTLSTEEFNSQIESQSQHKFEGFIKDAQNNCSWPVTLKEVSLRTCLSEHLLESYYKCHKKFLVKNNQVTLTNLRETQKIVYILREAGGPMNSVQVHERYKFLFSQDVSVRNIHAALGHAKEAVIVERGTYCLYENISLNATDFEEIKELVHEFLLKKNQYCSSKFLFKKIFKQTNSRYDQELTYYLMHGILQGDSRFTIERGLMVGLNHKNFTGKFSSLNEEVFLIIEHKGPISESDIINELSSNRDIFGINNIIHGSDELCSLQLPLEGTKFDLVERVIGDEATLGSLLDAIQINLLRSPLDPSELITRLRSVGFEQNPRAILHMAISHENIDPVFKLKKLTSVKLIKFERRFEEYLEDQSVSDYLYKLDSFNTNIKIDTSLEDSLISSLLWEN